MNKQLEIVSRVRPQIRLEPQIRLDMSMTLDQAIISRVQLETELDRDMTPRVERGGNVCIGLSALPKNLDRTFIEDSIRHVFTDLKPANLICFVADTLQLHATNAFSRSGKDRKRFTQQTLEINKNLLEMVADIAWDFRMEGHDVTVLSWDDILANTGNATHLLWSCMDARHNPRFVDLVHESAQFVYRMRRGADAGAMRPETLEHQTTYFFEEALSCVRGMTHNDHEYDVVVYPVLRDDGMNLPLFARFEELLTAEILPFLARAEQWPEEFSEAADAIQRYPAVVEKLRYGQRMRFYTLTTPIRTMMRAW